MDIEERNDEMRRLRFEKGWTNTRIGERFGISSERVRQIIGNTGYLASELLVERINSPQYSHLTNDELSEIFDLGPTYIGTLRRGYYPPKPDSSRSQNYVATMEVADRLSGEVCADGIILVGDYRIKVLYRGTVLSPPAYLGSPYVQIDCNAVPEVDFLVVVVGEPSEFYVIPLKEWNGSTIRIYPNARKKEKYSRYREAWHLLEV